MDVDVGGLNLRRPELRTRLSNIGERSGAAVIAVFGKLQGALRGLDRIVEQPALRIGRPQLEVIDRQFRRQGEPRSFEIGGRGPCPLETKQLDNLPPITRSFSDLAALTPGLLVGVGTVSSALGGQAICSMDTRTKRLLRWTICRCRPGLGAGVFRSDRSVSCRIQECCGGICQCGYTLRHQPDSWSRLQLLSGCCVKCDTSPFCRDMS